MLQSKKEGSHLRRKTASKGLNVRELVEMIEMKKDGATLSPAVACIVSFCERKLR